MFKAQCGSRCVLRCSRLNAALGFKSASHILIVDYNVTKVGLIEAIL